MPDMFQYLKEHLHFYPIQKGYCAMLGDKDNVERPFYVSNYDGGLSSMFNFSKETLEQGWMGLKLKM